MIRSEGQPDGRPNQKKPTDSCEEQLGLGTAKAVITSKAVTVHASTLFRSLAGASG